ncbi:1-acyl-sn-glycerol-3-phosphate acyltransferase [Amycolatopsis acidiphila]|uniref:1-acyl-sn-glycerol-3-phosphate acyltransferase n=1 Tax=Amycolatopsis acidiphila TaxID=715473 RepID=A0A558A4T4_9PSEU|nr:lysophospholipid acyltransferase family protein [Amycolatopsis acidiphila]TVT19267.1 1-acyl-sn-glycerol-3-phosphate acyltransferase [Amycolatopsis acidiphila]UIJ62306.1 1-acyl-sn-glycerol-3-phosphate acyltransferase [Amycolatopsis acidiphila]GHG96770.1 1-acyl-sn-glycerol-3-phosphate acyltransferase [Amycolatopsis acidiphila]
MSSAGLPEGASGPLHDFGRLIGRVLFRPAFRVRVRGLERVPRSGPVVLIANHSSMVEPQLIFGMLPRRSVFLVKEEMFAGAQGWFLRRIGQVPVRRGAPDRAPLLTTAQILREGGLVGVFPEGTRGDGDVATAERGAAWLLRGTDAQVLPVAVRGTKRPADRGRRFRPRVDVLVGEPFRVRVGKGRAGLAEATERLRGELAALVRELDEQRAQTEKAKS